MQGRGCLLEMKESYTACPTAPREKDLKSSFHLVDPLGRSSDRKEQTNQQDPIVLLRTE